MATFTPSPAPPDAAQRPPAARQSAILDTNVVLACYFFGDPRCQALARAVEHGAVRWLATAAMRKELALVLDRGFGVRYTADPAAVLERFDRLASLQPEAVPSGLVCADADDQKFVDLALAHGASWLLTRDRALLKLRGRAVRRGVAVVPPERWRAADACHAASARPSPIPVATPVPPA